MAKTGRVRWQLVFYDLVIFLLVEFFLLIYTGPLLTAWGTGWQCLLTMACIFGARLLGGVYGLIWRYGGIQCYMSLMLLDGIGCSLNILLELLLPMEPIAFSRLIAICSMNLLVALAMRMTYRYAYKFGNDKSCLGKLNLLLLRIFAGTKVEDASKQGIHRIRVAIVGAGRVGAALAEELINNPSSSYLPVCFVDCDREKVGRRIHGIPVLLEDGTVFGKLKKYEIQEVVFAISSLHGIDKQRLYQQYQGAHYRIKVYDYPVVQAVGSKRSMREFDIEELLFRKQVRVVDEATKAYYKDKVVLLTGGGGSIGSELCRQIAKMAPKQLIILDIYENCAYDLQQELKFSYKTLDVQVEIVSITNKLGLERVFAAYRPQIVINAAAHKHVPLMEKNCIEAVENNIFGTLKVAQCCEEYGAQRFIMVSTDKAVNPTNVMGATKRMCEMIMQAFSTVGRVKYSATRFGNVLGSAGSVIPLFKRQIAAGGPITLTDKRIIRYFMTIPEAAQLVLASGAMAKNGELFVLDMGQPVRIFDLAENMIRLAGVQGIEIVETGLRPGEKLYEELLVKTEELDKTDNELIFIERDTPVTMAELEEKLETLRAAVASNEDEQVKAAMKQVVPTYRSPEEVNGSAVVKNL